MLGLAGAIMGGCDVSGISQPAGMIPRAEYNRALADAKQQREEAARQRAEAQKWQAQAQQDRQLVEQLRSETGKIFETLREEGQAKSAKVPSLQQANEDLVGRIHSLGKRAKELESDLSRAVQEYKSIQEENRVLRAGKTGEAQATIAPAPAAAPAVSVVGSTPEQERQRLLAQAAKELGEVKDMLAGGGKGEVSATTQPSGGLSEADSSSATTRRADLGSATSRPAAAGLGGAVIEARGARAKIALGARDGLRKETRMYIHRGSQFIGVLQLTTIDDQTAEGIVDGRLSAAVGDQAVVFGD